MMRSFLFIILFIFSCPLLSFSQHEIKAVFTDIPPDIDGFVNESIWSEAAVINEFYQQLPKNGEPATEKTEFLFLFDRNNIYIGVRCYDDPSQITAKDMARDVDLSNDDRIQLIFDTYFDGRSGYWFQLGPRGSIGDALVDDNGKNFNKSWDGLWNGRARITDLGWEGEMVIPFKTMGFKKGNDTWGLKCIRHIRRKSESVYWPATSLNAERFQISDAGKITGLTNITQGIGLDLVPYLTGGFSKKQESNSKPLVDGGMDAFYQITPSLKAALTVRTDFAQTEVDEKQINLTRFSLYFPEKRDFFLDGSNYFIFGINGDDANPQNTRMIPFFSRRIGLDKDGNPVEIKYGAKFTGKAGDWNFGFLHIKDDNQWDNPGYSTGRIVRNFGKQSSVGLIGTHGNALSETSNSLAGIDLKLATSELSGDKNIAINLYGVKSFTKGTEGDDFSFGAEVNYPNDFFRFRLGYLRIGDNFTPGLGFLPRKNIRDFYGGFTFGPRPQNSRILQIKSGMDYTLLSDLRNGGLLSSQVNITYSAISFLSGDMISLSSQYEFDKLQADFPIVESVSIPAGEYNFWRHSLLMSSAQRRNVWGLTKISTGSFYSGSRTDLLLQAGYKICIPVYLGLESDRRWVNLQEGDFITQIYRINLNFLISPSIYWYNFAQYENQSETIGWQSRFQWIIKPGKEIFLTYNSPLIDPMERFRPEIYEARLKVKYTIRF
ncbi:MAG: carbohydrate binding family 9 domain-containing protein [Bacteroidetes bacterium]|jgi:hypothetical protein|nr:carbohydrate binding family 9 domain-containing protein [Bacteroidota bacterium]